MIAEIVAVGSEMLTPHRQDTNSLYLTAQLNELGITVAFKTIVGDSLEQLIGVARTALERADLVIFSGGLGPTEDDLTREAVAAALGIGLREDAALVAGLEKRFAARQMTMPPNNRKQAEVLEGATLLENANGTASGQYLEAEVGGRKRIVVLLPGPPRELKAMAERVLKPRLQRVLPERHIATRVLKLALLPESQVDARTAPIYKQYPDVETTILAHAGEIQLNFLCSKPTLAEAQARVEEVAERIEEEMGDAVFSANGETLEEIVLLHLGMRHLTLAVAESCTGGLLAGRLTAIPNSSATFLGGAVVYTTELKTAFADVPQEMICEHGAVSEEVARALAEGIRKRTGASIGIGITGLAGPGGGPPGPDESRPVGLVLIGLANGAGEGSGSTVKQVHLQGDRQRIRWWATQHALEMLRSSLL